MNYIVDDIGQVIQAMRDASGEEFPYYMYGHIVEINSRLNVKNRGGVDEKQTKYPLIALSLDVEEEFSEGLWTFNLNLVIATRTEKKYNADQRYENVFKPVLYPLYHQFMTSLAEVGLFIWQNDQAYPEHTKIDRPFYGVQGSQGNTENLFDDPIDAIEIQNLRISKEETC